MRRPLNLLLCCCLLLSACGNAPGRRAEARKQVYPAEDAGVRCTIERRTGSHVGQRVCTTAAEREAARAEAQEAVRSLPRSGSSGNSDPGGLAR